MEPITCPILFLNEEPVVTKHIGVTWHRRVSTYYVLGVILFGRILTRFGIITNIFFKCFLEF